jgi:gamma-glutamylaminecyclotransferase
MATLLFLYGTLKRGCRNHPLMEGQEFLGPAETLPRYRLYDYGPYPCLVEDGASGVAVRGELWRVDAAALARLDAFEEVGHTFARREVALTNVAGPVFAYFFSGDVSGFADCGAEWSLV